ncbi:biotin--[acetyl-CoA-carboxylase] ligase [Peptoniphilus catoniae]|uniref:biotin--[acetyl-CoA-carboxylase] ligase n=1 Tax=Peptoniphilus catoniae TaxID=1660341 RepID=UPI0010FE4F25|nr:biotin--[acetyl-CoA-carboxylase] ligase [Peptoniphilus catoniae]
MNTKEKILKLLEESRDTFISGEDLGRSLNISRSAIWKGVNSLREEGFLINSSPNKGYRLDESCDKLNKYGILKDLRKELRDMDIMVYDSIDSTNTQMKRLLYSGTLKNFSLIVSNEQTAGRGRRGKDFLSPKETGIYFSLCLFPKEDFKMDSFDLITVKAAVAVALAIDKSTGKNPKIKWVNDIFINGRKVCGILSEADADFETKHINSIIVGIGVNFTTKESTFGKELSTTAGSINEKSLLRNQFLAQVLNEFYSAYYEKTDEEILDLYRSYSLVLGKEVEFELNGQKYTALAKDFDEKGNLIVKFKDGSEKNLSSGEISVKGDFYS